MATKKNVTASKVETVKPLESGTITETKIAKKEVKASPLKISRENFTYMVPGMFNYRHEGSLDECKVKGAFSCIQSRNFGVRAGDIVVCKNEKEAILIVVQ